MAAVALVAIMATGSFQKWERAMFAFIAISLVQIPMFFLSHPHWGTIAKNFVVPGIYGGPDLGGGAAHHRHRRAPPSPPGSCSSSSPTSSTSASRPASSATSGPTPSSARSWWSGGAAAIMVTANYAASGTPAFGHFTDALGVANLLKAKSHGLGALFAILLFDASIIGAAAVTLSTSYAFGDVFGIRHSLHRSFKDAKQFYLSYIGHGGRWRPGSCSSPEPRSA